MDRLLVVCTTDARQWRARYKELPCEYLELDAGPTDCGSLGRGRWGQIVRMRRHRRLPGGVRDALRRRGIELLLTLAEGYLFTGVESWARQLGLPWVLVVMDDWLFTRNLYRVPPLARYADRLLARAYRHATARWVLTPYARDIFRASYGADAEVWPVAAEVNGQPESGGADESGPFQILWMGSTNPSVLPMLCDVRDVLREIGGELALATRPGPDELAAMGLPVEPPVRLLGWVTPDRLAGTLRRASGVLVTQGPADGNGQLELRVSFPSKTAEVLAAGACPFVYAPPGASVARFCREHGVGPVAEFGDRAGLRRALIQLHDDPELRLRYREKALAVARRVFDLPAVQRRMYRRLSALARPERLDGLGHRAEHC